MTLDGDANHVVVPGETRIDDPTDRLFATTTRAGNVPSVFLPGTTATEPGTHLQFRFTKSGRYLVVCMNRDHFVADWMFGFIDVVGEGDNGHQ